VSTREVSQRRKLATVLFCDVSGSTALGERADPEAVRELMFRYFHEMRSALEHHGGTVEKFIGDAVVAVFGVPDAREDDALRAVRAAAEMQERATVLNEELEKRFGTRIALRIGINTGEVVAGDATTRETFVTGDAVNVAARLEQHAAPGDVLLGEATHDLVREAVSAEGLDPIAVRGKAGPLRVHRLVEVRLQQGRPVRRATSAFVGRAHELAALEAALAEALEKGACLLQTIVGDPGVGKSRLAAELVRSVEDRIAFLDGRCLSYGEGITYWPLSEILRSAARIRDEDSADQAQARLARLLPDDPAAATHLGRLLGLIEGVSTSAEIAFAVRTLLVGLASRQPLLLLIDDIQWAEHALLDLILDLPRSIEAPVFVLCLARPELLEHRPDWAPTLDLEPLDDEASSHLLRSVLGAGSLAGDVHAHVAAAARGNPLFIEEFVGMLVDTGVLERTNGSWRATREIADFPVPPTLTALLGERLDRLDHGLRLVLERASVEGEVFHRGAVVALSPSGERENVAPSLIALTEQTLVRPAAASFVDEAAFRFRHLLLREAAYRGSAKRVRAELHERFADWLEQSAGDRVMEYEEILGYHLERSYRLRTELGPPDETTDAIAERAAMHLGNSGRRAFRRGDIRAANSLLGRALELAGEPSIDVAVDLMETKLGFADYAGARSIADLLAGRSEIERAYADVYRSFVELQQEPEGATKGALRRAHGATAVFERLEDDRGLAKAWALRGAVHFGRGQLRRSAEAGARCHQFALRAGDLRQAADGLKMMDSAAFWGPSSATETATLFAEHIEWARGHADLGSEAEWLVSTAVLEAWQGHFDQARETAARGEELLRKLGSYIHFSAFSTSAQIAVLAGDYAEAERLRRESYATLEHADERGFLSTVAFELGRTLVEQGKLNEALLFAERSAELGGSDDVTTQFGWRVAKARVLAERGQAEEAERLAREAVALIEATEYVVMQAEALFELGLVLARGGKNTPAAAAFERSLALWEQKENLVMADRTRAALAQVEPQSSD
jgi:class 3 adenylate cyclase/tetratricopeptide (TPR) repeat protein